MTAARVLDWFLVAVVVFVWGFGAIRAATLRLRGVHVIAVDRQRTVLQGLQDLVALGSLALLAFEAIAFAWPLRFHLAPRFLHTVLFDSFVLRFLGAAMVFAALLLWSAAISAMGGAWRIGIDRNTPGALVNRGIFARSRNPIYLAFDLLAVGTFLLQGRLLFLVLALVLIPLLHLQIRREERFLTQVHGEAYRDYCARVGRYATVRRR
jgi:protein-S-isoprenylcysteine O-methyltransferase Ste14